MARMPNGILGGLIGTVGPVTGSIRLGVPVLRSKPKTTSYKQTPGREAQQAKMKVLLPFIQAFTGTGFFKKSFPNYGSTKTGYNLAVSYNMNMALTGAYPDIELSYPLAHISRGHLPKASEVVMIADEEGNLHFSWEDNSGTGKAKPTDKVLLVAYCPETAQVICSTTTGQRDECEATLHLPDWKGQNVETWIGFINEEETDAADSVYTGSWIL